MLVLLCLPFLLAGGPNEPPEFIKDNATRRVIDAAFESIRSMRDSTNTTYELATSALDSANLAYFVADSAQDSAATAMDTALAALAGIFDADTSRFGFGRDEVLIKCGPDTDNPLFMIQIGAEIMRNNAADDTIRFGAAFKDSNSYQFVWSKTGTTFPIQDLDSLVISKKYSDAVVMSKAWNVTARIAWVVIGL